MTVHQFSCILHFTYLCEVSKDIYNGCGMPTEDAYSSGHLVLSHVWTCMWSNIETNLSCSCLVSCLLSLEHPSVLLFCFEWVSTYNHIGWQSEPCLPCGSLPKISHKVYNALFIRSPNILEVPTIGILAVTSVHSYHCTIYILRITWNNGDKTPCNWKSKYYITVFHNN